MIPSFDPLAELNTLKLNTNELARAHNEHSEIIQQLLNQNRQLNNLIRISRVEVQALTNRINELEIYHRNAQAQQKNT